jgi:hypothetical protein
LLSRLAGVVAKLGEARRARNQSIMRQHGHLTAQPTDFWLARGAIPPFSHCHASNRDRK